MTHADGLRNGKRVTINRESFLNGNAELRDAEGNAQEVTWDISWEVNRYGVMLWSHGLLQGDHVYFGGELVFVGGQQRVPSG